MFQGPSLQLCLMETTKSSLLGSRRTSALLQHHLPKTASYPPSRVPRGLPMRRQADNLASLAQHRPPSRWWLTLGKQAISEAHSEPTAPGNKVISADYRTGRAAARWSRHRCETGPKHCRNTGQMVTKQERHGGDALYGGPSGR